jgi:methionine-rich copper-binding protein CopC
MVAKHRVLAGPTSLSASLWVFLLVFMSTSLYNVSSAHAVEVTSTSPAIDATVVVAPNFVSVTADQELLEFGNALVVISPSNERVDDGLITVSGNTVSVGMTELKESGKYLVEYELLVAEDSPLFGNFSFRFQAPPVIDESTASPSPGNEDAVDEDGSRAVGSNLTDYLVIALLVLAFFILMWLARFARSTFRKE